ncbi:DUF2752 domain-containing protein [Sphingobacterium deserti]|uniref:DUF2752 domain-containing protein n=1 Tax=Sphingobacterium deserti TaxID=1229276 RepID=A0A0B8T8H8_9SPHI|nr:DUF2752 domain-containing protein [Sphingobacterium deserti]KGE14225.1 hypothetical protein DI53_2055 [Sphingobacterium deserti]
MLTGHLRWLFIGLGAGIVSLLIYIYYKYDPLQSAWFPKCPFKTFTGLDCPGCGSQRAIHALLHGDFSAAVRYNALLLPFIPYVLIGTIFQWKQNLTAPMLRWRRILYGEWAIKIVATVILLYFIGRNIY